MQKLISAKTLEDFQSKINMAATQGLYVVNSPMVKRGLSQDYVVTVSDTYNKEAIEPAEDVIQKVIYDADIDKFNTLLEEAGEEGLEPIGDIVSRGMINSEYVAIVSNIALISGGGGGGGGDSSCGVFPIVEVYPNEYDIYNLTIKKTPSIFKINYSINHSLELNFDLSQCTGENQYSFNEIQFTKQLDGSGLNIITNNGFFVNEDIYEATKSKGTYSIYLEARHNKNWGEKYLVMNIVLISEEEQP